jgi:hypothetical protein
VSLGVPSRPALLVVEAIVQPSGSCPLGAGSLQRGSSYEAVSKSKPSLLPWASGTTRGSAPWRWEKQSGPSRAEADVPTREDWH